MAGPAGGGVRVVVCAEDGSAVLVVEGSGPGIRPAERARLRPLLSPAGLARRGQRPRSRNRQAGGGRARRRDRARRRGRRPGLRVTVRFKTA